MYVGCPAPGNRSVHERMRQLLTRKLWPIYEDFGQTYAGSQYVVGVFALNDDGSPAGSIAYGNGTVSKAYCACALRYPYVLNAEPYATMNMVGIESY